MPQADHRRARQPLTPMKSQQPGTAIPQQLFDYPELVEYSREKWQGSVVDGTLDPVVFGKTSRELPPPTGGSR